MRRFKLLFIRKFQLAFVILMLATLAISWFYNESVEWYQHDVQRITLANEILAGYQELSSLVARNLNGLSEAVLRGDSSDLAELGVSAAALQEVISTVHRDIAKEAAFGGSSDIDEDLEQLLEIERLVDEIIRSSKQIEQAFRDGRIEDARDQLEVFRNSGRSDDLDILIAVATEDHKIKARGEERQATALSLSIAKAMPVLLAVMVAVTLFSIFILSRRLTRSINALHVGALALKNDELSYRIPELSEVEFRRLGEAFNTMAIQLSEHREQLRDSNIQLEDMIEKRTGELLESNKKLEDVDATRRKLLADISHEFRTPITVIRGEAEIALRGSGKTQADHEESFRRIMDQADNATRLVDDLLFIARADAGEPRLKLSAVSIVDLIASVCQEFAARAKRMGIKIEQVRMDSKAHAQGDPGRLRQVFSILMENALKYSNPGDRVEIEVLQGNDSVEIMFRDEGIGLTEEESELVFDRFYRAPGAVEKSTGTGLGLPVAKAIVDAHHGSISLTGKPGQGATASVVLPFGRPFGIVA